MLTNKTQVVAPSVITAPSIDYPSPHTSHSSSSARLLLDENNLYQPNSTLGLASIALKLTWENEKTFKSTAELSKFLFSQAKTAYELAVKTQINEDLDPQQFEEVSMLVSQARSVLEELHSQVLHQITQHEQAQLNWQEAEKLASIAATTFKSGSSIDDQTSSTGSSNEQNEAIQGQARPSHYFTSSTASNNAQIHLNQGSNARNITINYGYLLPICATSENPIQSMHDQAHTMNNYSAALQHGPRLSLPRPQP